VLLYSKQASIFICPINTYTLDYTRLRVELEEELAKKQLLRPKLAEVRATGASKKIWDSDIYFCSH